MLQMYSIYDKKSGIYEKPFFVKHVAEATRAVHAGLNGPEDRAPWFAKYPADYSLFFVGSWDPASGMYTPTSEGVPVWVVEVVSLKEGGVT